MIPNNVSSGLAAAVPTICTWVQPTTIFVVSLHQQGTVRSLLSKCALAFRALRRRRHHGAQNSRNLHLMHLEHFPWSVDTQEVFVLMSICTPSDVTFFSKQLLILEKIRNNYLSTTYSLVQQNFPPEMAAEPIEEIEAVSYTHLTLPTKRIV